MANYTRNDPSSMSFGRRLMKAETDAADAKRELKQLKENLPEAADLRGAAMAADVIKQQRKAAKQMMARADVSLEELNGIDPSVLTPMFQEQLRHSKKDAAWRELTPEPPAFKFQTPEAQQRFQHWQSAYTPNPQQQVEFAQANLPPEQETPFQKWDRRQKSLAGRKWNEQRRAAEYDRDLMKQRFKDEQTKKSKAKENGRRVGGFKDLNS